MSEVCQAPKNLFSFSYILFLLLSATYGENWKCCYEKKAEAKKKSSKLDKPNEVFLCEPTKKKGFTMKFDS